MKIFWVFSLRKIFLSSSSSAPNRKICMSYLPRLHNLHRRKRCWNAFGIRECGFHHASGRIMKQQMRMRLKTRKKKSFSVTSWIMHFLVDFPINFAVRFHSQTQLGRAKWKEKYLPILMDIASWKATTFRWLASSFECSSCTMKGEKLLKWKIVSYDKQCTLGKLSSTRKAFRFSSYVFLGRDKTWLKKALEHSGRAHDRKNYVPASPQKAALISLLFSSPLAPLMEA